MTWEELLAEFRELGGIADNVALRQGALGRGIFPIDPEKPVRLRTPPNLLVASADTEVQQGRLVVRQSATLGGRERIFFERYQQGFPGARELSMKCGKRSAPGANFRNSCKRR